MHLTKDDIEQLPRIKRLNLINSITGIKPANLIATRSKEGQANVAIFSSVVHLGSNPALIGLFFRPQHEKPRDTYLNIKSTGVYSINHVPMHLIEKAHYTSAKFPAEVSEFERCGLTEEFIDGFHAPFVKDSLVRIGLEFKEEIRVNSNDTILMIGQIQHLLLRDNLTDEEGVVDLESAASAGISGVNTYYNLNRVNRFPYAHLFQVPEFK